MTTHATQLGADRYIEPADIPSATVTSVHELVTADGARVSGVLRSIPGATTVAFIMHPRQDSTHHVLMPELLSHGYAVWTQGARSVGTDLTLLHEQALLDMAAGHVFLRGRGFESVVSVGHSGGGTLAAFYLEQALLPPSERLATTPGGRPVPLPDADMPASDGLMLMAPHPGQGALLERVIDPSVVDDNDPMSVDPSLNPYDPANGFLEPPHSSSYGEEFVARYRQAQAERIRRLDEVARERVAASKAANRRFHDGADPLDRRAALAAGVIVVHRTDADLRNVDLSLEPSERPYGSLFGKRPDLTNYGIVGFGRLTTPEAFLSTWSARSTRADLARCAPGVNLPTLLVELTGDQACYPADAARFATLFPHPDVTHVRVPGRHFGAALRKGMSSGATLAGAQMASWLDVRFPSLTHTSR